MKLIKALSEASTIEVESNDLMWRISSVRSADLAKVGVAALTILPSMLDGDEAKETDPNKALKAASPDQVSQVVQMQEATVCAGVTAVGDGEEWNDLKVVMVKKQANPNKGILWVGDMPPGSVSTLFSAIMELSTDEGGATERLQQFRGKPRLAAVD